MNKVDEAITSYEKLFEYTKSQLKEKQQDIISNDLEYEWYEILKPSIKQYIKSQDEEIALYKGAYESANEVNHIQGNKLDRIKDLPTFYINNKSYYEYDDIQQILDDTK